MGCYTAPLRESSPQSRDCPQEHPQAHNSAVMLDSNSNHQSPFELENASHASPVSFALYRSHAASGQPCGVRRAFPRNCHAGRTGAEAGLHAFSLRESGRSQGRRSYLLRGLNFNIVSQDTTSIKYFYFILFYIDQYVRCNIRIISFLDYRSYYN